MLCHDEQPHVIGIVETWLTSKHGNAEIQLPSYQITRRDRQYCKHGAILLYTKDGIGVQRRDDPALEIYEDLMV